MKKIKLLFIFILILLICTPLCLLWNPFLFHYKFHILTIMGFILYVIMRAIGANNNDLGFQKGNILTSCKRNLPCITLCITMIIFMKILGVKRYDPNESIYFYAFYILVSCPIQEFLYRGIFGYFDQHLIKNHNISLLLSSFCYAFVHIIYRDIITCIVTFIVGMFWYHLYKKDDNLFGVTLSHCILGILTIWLGLIN